MYKHGGFKARPLKKEIFTKITGLAHVEKMPCTTEFNLFNLRQKKSSIEESVQSSIDRELEECRKQFKARELKKSILEKNPL